MNADKLTLVVFDLDNTIADETIWLFAAYRDIADSIQSQTGEPSQKVLDAMVERFRRRGRKDLFQECCSRYSLPTSMIDSWLELMRSVRLEHGFQMFEWVGEFCRLIPGVQKAVLTNGNARQQKAKFRQLSPKSVQQEFKLFCAAELEPKPSPEGLRHVMRSLGATSGSTVFLGDSAEDSQCAAAAGVLFVNASQFKHQSVSKSLTDLLLVLNQDFIISPETVSNRPA